MTRLIKLFATALLAMLLPCAVKAQSAFTVYGLARNSNPAQVHLATIQPGTGVVSEISPVPLTQGYALNPLSAIDPVNDRFYFGVGPGLLLSVDINTGLIADTVTLNIPFPTYFDLMQYNCRDSSMYGLYRTNNPTACYLAKADMNTGQLTVISPSPVSLGYSLNAKSTLDAFNNIYYYFGAGGLLGLDLTTGLPVVQVPFSFTGPVQIVDMMTYNCGDGNLYCVTRSSSSQGVYPARINTSTGLVTNLSTTPIASFISINAMSEINPAAGLFHFSNGSQFISFDVNTGNVVSSPPLSFSPSPGNIFFDLIARDNCKCFLSNPNVGMAETAAAVVKIFPNPAAEGQPVQVVFPAEGKERVMRIYDIAGKMVEERNLQAGENNLLIYTDQLPAGSYVLAVEGLNPVKLLLTQ
ncbi:MAG: T9SS type A sorting domain-containing protein [Bacteroidia bacterium]|jgi:hypothetical protein|nr:T9SS type A sorting domain-containing protein [Bacteroidia bacterium]